ncbi:hypothetical protein DC025_14710, partial [Enterococcus faecalis]
MEGRMSPTITLVPITPAAKISAVTGEASTHDDKVRAISKPPRAADKERQTRKPQGEVVFKGAKTAANSTAAPASQIAHPNAARNVRRAPPFR